MQRRKYCLHCSPYGQHNTKQLVPKNRTLVREKQTNNSSDRQRICNVCQRLHTRRGRVCRSCSTKVRRYLAKQAAVKYLGGKCQRCGWSGSLPAYEFHHIDPSRKKFTIGNVSHRKWELIVKELDKCELLCANCHRIEHSDHNDLVKQEASQYKGRLFNFLRGDS
ncbi:MAG: HNH endonuclease [Cyanosarcina radialis HA8281-LM2]|nr:HNH endonuclease [Cyanosarcina radialis HA8281-LM2]